jgi:hypothetical protein
MVTIHLPDDEERWRTSDKKGDDSDDGFYGQRHLGNGLGGQERL